MTAEEPFVKDPCHYNAGLSSVDARPVLGLLMSSMEKGRTM
jgi:hypothetical protein